MAGLPASLLLVLIVVVGCWSSPTPPPISYNSSRWMQELQKYIYHRSLLDIQLPGTHDSGAYEFSDSMSPLDPKIVDTLIKIAYDLDIDIYQFIKNWSQTQDTTIYEQLVGGIRYLDLRACYIVDDWYTQHFLIGMKTQDLLNDVQTFMAENTGELIVVELGELIPQDEEPTLLEMIETTLGPYLAPRQDLRTTTIGNMIKKNHRIILLYPQSNFTANHTFLWDKTVYMDGSYANKDKLSEMEEWNIGQILTLGGYGQIFEFSWTLTTQDKDIIRTLLDPWSKTNTLKDFALIADGALDSFVSQYSNYMLGNILLLDWWEHSNVVQVAIDFNLRMCNDDPDFVGVNPDGQFCRAYIYNHNCTAPEYQDWMSEHCRLSCGFC